MHDYKNYMDMFLRVLKYLNATWMVDTDKTFYFFSHFLYDIAS